MTTKAKTQGKTQVKAPLKPQTQKYKEQHRTHLDTPQGRQRVIDIIRRSRGIISAIASNLDVTRQTIYNWVDQNKDIKDALTESREGFKDVLEAKIFKVAIEDEDRTMLIFLAKTLMKDRGYTEHIVTEHKAAEDTELTLVVKGSRSNLLDPEKI